MNGHTSLGELIAYLEALPEDTMFRPGFTNPHSYRGDYCQLAFEPVESSTAANMCSDARSALGNTFGGYKGGEFLMDDYSPTWIAEYGHSNGEPITFHGLEYRRLMGAQ